MVLVIELQVKAVGAEVVVKGEERVPLPSSGGGKVEDPSAAAATDEDIGREQKGQSSMYNATLT